MKTIDDAEIKKLAEDVAAIKSVLKKNIPIVRQALSPAHFRLLSFIGGIVLIAMSMLYYYLMNVYGGYDRIPSYIRTIMLVASIVGWILFGILKQFLWIRSLEKRNSSVTLRVALKEFFSFKILHIYLPITGMAILLVVYFLDTGNAYYIIPACTIGFGFIYNFLGSISGYYQYLVSGYWFLITGCVLLFYPISAPLAVSVSLGFGWLLFALVAIRGE